MYYNAIELINEIAADQDLAESVAYSAGIDEEDVPELVAFLRKAVNEYYENQKG